MPENIEIKARLSQPRFAAVTEIAAKLSNSDSEILHQVDTFFDCNHGRLKLRQIRSAPKPVDPGNLDASIAEVSNELIQYQRPDQESASKSVYHRVPLSNAEEMKNALGLSMGVVGEIKKRRTLYMIGNTRVHLDEVKGLGSFLELEVVKQAGQSDTAAFAIAQDLIQKLGLTDDELVATAYIDLLLSRIGA